MNNCKPTITYSDSQEVFDRIGAIITSSVIKQAMSGKGFPEIGQSLNNIQSIAFKSNLFERHGLDPASGTRIVEDRISSANYNWLKQFENVNLEDEGILKEFNEQVEIIAENIGEIDEEIQDTNGPWFFNETLDKLYCVTDSDPFIGDTDEIFLFGDMIKNGQKKVEEREFMKEKVDTGDTVKIMATYKKQLIDIGQTVFRISQTLVDDDGIGEANVDELKKELVNIKVLIGKAATAEIRKFLRKSVESQKGVEEALLAILLELIAGLALKGLDVVLEKLIETIGSWFGPDLFTPIQFVVKINYDGKTPPRWSFKTISEGESKDSKNYVGEVSVMPEKVRHVEVDKSDKGEYTSMNILRVFKSKDVA